jgi:sortase (surface protein transpeptidase)
MSKPTGRHESPERRVPPGPGEPPRPGGPPRHRRLKTVSKWSAIAVLGCGLLGTGIGACGLAEASKHPGHPAVTPGGPPSFVAIPKGKGAAVPKPSSDNVARPVSLIIPVIGVKTSLIHLGLTKSHELQVPSSTRVAGWYTSSPRPGSIGSAIIAGHIDSRNGPGVFYRLHTMKIGEKVWVRRADGSIAIFRVTAIHSYLKAQFPAQGIYGPAPTPQLTLITCGGAFDPATGHYLSNVIVFATMIR